MPTHINKHIQVGAVFTNALIKPRWFIWEGRKYQVKTINLAWQRPEGAAMIHYFSVSDDCSSYELAFNSKDTTWRLMKIDGSPQ